MTPETQKLFDEIMKRSHSIATFKEEQRLCNQKISGWEHRIYNDESEIITIKQNIEHFKKRVADLKNTAKNLLEKIKKLEDEIAELLAPLAPKE